MDQNGMNPVPQQPGSATASMVLGIVALVMSLFIPIIGVICGIIGIFLSNKAKKEGAVGGKVTAGLVCSIIGIAIGGVTFIACAICAGTLGAIGSMY